MFAILLTNVVVFVKSELERMRGGGHKTTHTYISY